MAKAKKNTFFFCVHFLIHFRSSGTRCKSLVYMRTWHRECRRAHRSADGSRDYTQTAVPATVSAVSGVLWVTSRINTAKMQRADIYEYYGAVWAHEPLSFSFITISLNRLARGYSPQGALSTRFERKFQKYIQLKCLDYRYHDLG